MTQQSVQLAQTRAARGNLHQVQRVLRSLIWFVLFCILAGVTLFIAFRIIDEDLGTYIALGVGGFFSLVIPGMISRSLYVIPEFERVVILKLGKFIGVRGPGLFWVIPYPPFYQSVAMVLDLRVQTRVITAAETLTADNVPVGCEAVVFWRVEAPKKAALDVANYHEAVFQAANSALKDTIGALELTGLLGERQTVSDRLKELIDKAAATFGVDVVSVEITDVHVPADLIQELSVLAQSRRAAQAKIAEAEAEKAIALKLQEASELLGPQAMEMYRLNVLERIGREEGSQIVIYGLGGSKSAFDELVAAAAAGVRSAPPPTPTTPPSTPSGTGS